MKTKQDAEKFAKEISEKIYYIYSKTCSLTVVSPITKSLEQMIAFLLVKQGFVKDEE